MATIFPPRLKILCDTCKPRKLSLHTRPYVTLSLFITTISISCLLSPDIKYLGAGAENTSSVIHIGALVSYDTINGRAARTAIQMAVDSINKDNNILNNSELVLHMLDTNCSAFPGVAAALELFKQEVIAVIGPQSTAVSRFVAHMATATQVPMLSFAVTDPNFSEQRYPYFFRIAHSDAMQMQAIASLIAMYKWRSVVIVHIDDDSGSSGAVAISAALDPLGIQVVQKVAVSSDSNRTTIDTVLTGLSAMQIRIFVVHMPQNLSLLFFSEAKYQGMMTSGYVWIASDLMVGTLNMATLESRDLSTLEGVVGVRGYYANSSVLKAFTSEWKNQASSGSIVEEIPIYGLYAYDATQMLAYAIDNYTKNGFNITFKNSTFPTDAASSSSDLVELKVFEGGPLLRNSILQTQFAGTSGYIQLDSEHDLIRSEFQIVNIIDGELKPIGYWTNKTKLSLSAPDNVTDASMGNAILPGSPWKIMWPGDSYEVPRGWVFPKNGRPLRIAVPLKRGFEQFLSYSKSNSTNVTTFSGYCIDVFLEALNYLPYTISYNFELFGNNTEPVYDDMIHLLAQKAFDGVVGDVTITTKRMEIVDFTQSIKESGLVVVVPALDSKSSNPWAFLGPFTPTMWFTTLAFFIFTGLVIWLLEHKKNRDFRGHPSKQVVTLLWFTFSTLFFSQRERTRSTFGRFVVLVWLFVVLIITSSYTANLTSILTVQQLSPDNRGISSLQTNTDPIGYQNGSFVKNQLISMNIAEDRLKPLVSMDDYARALTLGASKGGVAAIVEELPYVEIFLETKCGYTKAGEPFTEGGWGFAFQKDSQLAVDMSTAIIKLSETGDLKRIQDLWLTSGNCAANSNNMETTQLNLSSFWGLFLVTGTASALSLVIYLSRLLLQFSRLPSDAPESTNSGSRGKRFIKSFASYVDESAVGRDKKRGPNSGGKKKKNGAYPPDQSSSSEHRCVCTCGLKD